MTGIVTQKQGFDADYEAIELAVMETERGRWFLQEFARRNRQADTNVLLTALSRIERSIAVHSEPAGIDRIRLDVLEMSKAISRTRTEIAAIKPEDSKGGGKLLEASGELDAIVSATEEATSSILAAAESIQEAAWTLREAGMENATSDLLDQRATEIYMACSFQDLTAQRIRKIIDALGFLETRINTMVGIWDFDQGKPDHVANSRPSPAAASLDPAMSQADVDIALVDDPFADTSHGASPAFGLAGSNPPLSEVIELDMADAVTLDTMLTPSLEREFESGVASVVTSPTGEDADEVLFSRPAAEPGPAITAADGEHLKLVHDQPAVNEAMQKVRAGDSLSADEAARALDALRTMSVEERTRLFS
jgi:chemotaxis regulatin CheY-phosphate phosphatase CheZ